MKKYWVMLAAILLCLVIGGAPFAVAQDEEEGDEFMLEEITVTAQKREENQQKVAIAMEVITGEDLTAMGKNDIDEILQDIANVEISAARTGTRINIRGLVDDGGTMTDMQMQTPMVSLNVDGAYTNMNNAGNGLFDIERVEVLMGPQSTMYGANAPAGIVNIVTAAPKTDKFSADATVEYGSYDLLNLQGALNVPVIQDKLAMRVSANYTEQGTWVEGDPTSESTAVRLKTLWDVYEKLDVTVTGNWSKKSSGGLMGGRVRNFIHQDDDYYPLEEGQTTPDKLTDPWTPADENSAIGDRDDQITEGISAEINWSLPFGNLSIVPSYSESDASGLHTRESQSGGTTTYYKTDNNEQKGAEVRMTNNESFELFQWILGYTWNESYQYQLSDYESYDPTQYNELRDVTQNKSALFANVTYPLPFYDRLRLTVGFRQSWDESYGYEMKNGELRLQGNDTKLSKPNWKYGFEYDVADNMMVYGSFSSSYRSMNAFGQQVTNEDGSHSYAPNEELKSYTAGLKSRWLDNRLQVNLNVYFYDYTNKYCINRKVGLRNEAQRYTEDTITPVEPYEVEGGGPGGGPPPPGGQGPPPPGGGTTIVTYEEVPDGVYPSLDIYDADGDGITDEPLEFEVSDSYSNGVGDFQSLGIDLQTTFIITSKDRLNLSIAYLDAEWTDLVFRYEYWDWEVWNKATPANSPKWGVTSSYEHNFMLGALGTLTPKINMKYRSEYTTTGQWQSSYEYYIYAFQEAYTMWDASASFQPSSGNWSLNAYVKNITNYAVKTQAYVKEDGCEMRLGDPRTYGVTFSYKFF